MDGKDSSPWCVNNLDEFIYYCCPECDKRNKSKDSFLKHSLEEHPEARKHLEIFAVKEEVIIEQNLDNSKLDCDPFMDISVKEEIMDNIELPQDINLKENVKNQTEIYNKNIEFMMDIGIYEGSEAHEEVKMHQQSQIVENDFVEEEKDPLQEQPKFDTTSHESKKYEYNCEKCGKILKNRRNLNDHIKSVHEGLKIERNKYEYNCEKCGKTFNHKGNLNVHIKSFHEGFRTDPCQICGKDFSNKSKLHQHMEVHDNNKNHNCEKCGKTFKRRSQLMRHIKSMHEGILSEPCQFCGKKYAGGSENLKKHIKLVHEGLKNHICDACGVSFSKNALLQNHIKRVHEDKRDHPCNDCGKFFKCKFDLKNHIESIHEGVKHKCDICGKEFSAKAGVFTHKKFVHKIPTVKERLKQDQNYHSCNFCGEKFEQSNDLYVHSKSCFL